MKFNPPSFKPVLLAALWSRKHTPALQQKAFGFFALKGEAGSLLFGGER